MIPIKKMKEQIIKEFTTNRDAFTLMAQHRANRNPHNIDIPYSSEECEPFTARYNVKHKKFDRLMFMAFGRHHRIKL